MSAKLVELNGQRYSNPKKFVTEIAEHFEEDLPNAEQVLVIVGSTVDHEPDSMTFHMHGNRLTRAEKLWLLEMGKRVLFHESD